MPDDGVRHELVRGELRTMTLAGFEHGRVAATVGATIMRRGFMAATLGPSGAVMAPGVSALLASLVCIRRLGH